MAATASRSSVHHFFLAGGALLLGIPVYMAQRRHLTPLAPVPSYR
jgi:basic amino acid/polyamine antiporter, APA family